MPNKFTKNDGYNSSDLFHYGIDHLYSAGSLFELDAHCYDSAGYLSHLGVELILKGWHLYEFDFFKNTHCLVDLYNKLNQQIKNFELNKESLEILHMLDGFNELRYPENHSPVETGTDDWNKINTLVNNLWEGMPQQLLDELDKINASRKGGRILMRKKLMTNLTIS